MTPEEFMRIRETTLRNAESLVRAAKLLAERQFDHIRYHLAVLALEEVGKADLLGMKRVAETLNRPTETFDRMLDDHMRKLFWAFWGPSFGREKLTRQQIDSTRSFATRIHEKRLFYLYSDPEAPLFPEEKTDHQEVEDLVQLAEVRVEMAKVHQLGDIDESRIDEVQWFVGATEDPEKRKSIFSGPSMDKLVELGDVKAWVAWLRETFAEQDRQLREMLREELMRGRRGDDREGGAPKWRMKLRIYSHSHSIRQKALNKWNELSDFIKLSATGRQVYSRTKKDEILCELTLPRRVPIQALWDYGWGLSRIFVVALNIATRGFFWWYVPRDTERYYEEVWDLEKGAAVIAQPAKRLELDWGRWALDERDMPHVALLFGYLARVRGSKFEEPFNSYIEGLTYFSKIDWHMRLEANAFEAFWKAFRQALEVNGDWDGKGDLSCAAQRQLGEFLKTAENFIAFIQLGNKIEIAKSGGGDFPQITLTEVAGMKLYCDLYFSSLAQRSFREEKAKAK